MLSCMTLATLVCKRDTFDHTFYLRRPDEEVATRECKQLLHDLESAGLNTEARSGYDQTLLVFVQAPKDLLGNTVYKSRCVTVACSSFFLFLLFFSKRKPMLINFSAESRTGCMASPKITLVARPRVSFRQSSKLKISCHCII